MNDLVDREQGFRSLAFLDRIVSPTRLACAITPMTAYYLDTVKLYLRSLFSRGSKKRTIVAYGRILLTAITWLGGLPHTWTIEKGERWLTDIFETGQSLNYAHLRQAVIDGYVSYMNDRENGLLSHTIDILGAPIITPFKRGHRISKSTVRLAEPDVRPAYLSEILRLDEYLRDVARTGHKRSRTPALVCGAMFTTMAGFGLRCCETEHIRVSDLKKHLSLPQYGRFATLDVIGKAKPFGEPRPRTIYTVPHFDSITKILERYVGPSGPFGALAEDDYLFVNERGNQMTPDLVTHTFTKYRRAAGLPKDCTAHGLRRYYATHLYMNGVDLWFLSDQLGHEAVATTYAYIRFATHFRTQHVKRLQRLVLGLDGRDGTR